MARKKLSIPAPKPAREPETVKAEIKRLETLLRKSDGKPGFAERVAEINKRLEECRAELEAENG